MASLNFRVNDYFVDLDKRTIQINGDKQRISESEKLILVALIRAEGSFVSRNELLNSAWPGVVVSEASLVQAISNIRKKLGDQERVKRIILTGDKGGYAVSYLVITAESASNINEKVELDSVTVFQFILLGGGICCLVFLLFLSYLDITNSHIELEKVGSVSVFAENLTDSQKILLATNVSTVLDIDNDEIYITTSKKMLTVMSKTGKHENLLIWGWEDNYETTIAAIKSWYHH
ncbi:winged helix-turn-helix domain-containing protein [uncultured Shewanella sp.]|uniref:winged helix-turn-helix domain-containing protein n=1 Tax=uncultured Shewanella sp. TaxID=173975 RepID=UPI002633420B|nr:winged helix-turn-helix domain-containing protein [uncultured Shewanella sp.]